MQTNDPALVVLLATHNAISSSQDFFFRVFSDGKDKLTVYCRQGGTTTETTDNDTSFVFKQETVGVTEVCGIIDFTYNAEGDVSNIEAYS